MKLDKVLGVPKQAEAKKSKQVEEDDIDIDKIDLEAREMTEMYFNNEINEDETRLKLHRAVCDKMEKELDSTVQEGTNVRNFYLADRFKQGAIAYINYVRGDKFAQESTKYAVTQDNMRVDFGVVISRPPIFAG
jgi:hypothetical protein